MVPRGGINCRVQVVREHPFGRVRIVPEIPGGVLAERIGPSTDFLQELEQGHTLHLHLTAEIQRPGRVRSARFGPLQ